MNRIVVPGEMIADKPLRIGYSYTDGQKTFATVISLLSEDGKLIPLEGPYEPMAEDVVVGYVMDVRFAGFEVELGGVYSGFLSSRDSKASFRLGDIVVARIINVDEVRSIDLADGRKLPEGRLEHISPVKVPRLIGKKNSMINMIASATGCEMVVGRNGSIFVSFRGDHELARKSIRMIEEQAHTSGLTDRVAAMLTQATGKPVQPIASPEGVRPSPFAGMTPPPMEGGSEGGFPPREGGFRGGGRREGGFRSGGNRRPGGFRPRPGGQ